MHKTRLYTTLIGLWGTLCLCAAPKLTVIVVANGLDQSGLNELRPYWQQGGLRTLSEEAFQTTVTLDQWIYGGSEGVATLMTGVYPATHGITADMYFSRADRTAHSIWEDNKYSGINCSERLSVQHLLSPTLSDRVRWTYGNKAKIYAVGLNSGTTLLLAGHSANACCWLNPRTLQWCTTSFYSEGLPSAADSMNINGRLQTLSAKEWTPRMDITMYNHPTKQETKKAFTYKGSKTFLYSPYVNTAITELALDIQRTQHLGEDGTPDLLLLEYTCRSPQATSDLIQSAEQEDMYLWLNQDLGYLMDQLNRRIGKANYQILLVGNPCLGIGSSMMASVNMPCHLFNVDQAAALTSTYLMALYGHERWVDGGLGQTIFLNRTLIEQKRLSLETIQRQVSNFLMEFEGVQIACPAHEAFLNPEMATSINKRFAGDIVFMLQPGWQLIQNDDTTPTPLIEHHPRIPVLYWSGSTISYPQTLTALDMNKLIGL